MPGARTLGLTLLLTSIALGCSSSQPSARELRVGLGEDMYVADGPGANVGGGLNITETLTRLTPDLGLAPGLAERWEHIEGSRWRFFLRRGITFQDGQPLDAQAVKIGLFDRVAKQSGTTINAGPDSAVVVDDHTIDFTPTQPDSRVPAQLTHPVYGVYAPGSDPATKPIGTGPFRFASYDHGQQIVVERNDRYWGPAALSERITFRFLPEPEVRRQALEAGEIDIATLLRPTDAAELKDKNLKVQKSPAGSYDAMYANIHKPGAILADQGVRLAVASAIDRRAIVDQLLEGQANADVTMVPAALLGDDAALVKGHPFDPARAKQLLDGAGWVLGAGGTREKDGRSLHLDMAVSSAQTFGPLPALLQSQLKAIGVDVKILDTPDVASYFSLVTGGQADLYLEQGSQNDADAAFLPFNLFYSSATAEEVNYPALFAPGETFDRLLAPALSDDRIATEHRAVAEAMHYIVDDQAVVIPVAGIPDIYGTAKTVRGFVPSASFVSARWDTIAAGSE